MWQPRRLKTLWASTACYREGVKFFTFYGHSSEKKNSLISGGKRINHYDRIDEHCEICAISGTHCVVLIKQVTITGPPIIIFAITCRFDSILPGNSFRLIQLARSHRPEVGVSGEVRSLVLTDRPGYVYYDWETLCDSKLVLSKFLDTNPTWSYGTAASSHVASYQLFSFTLLFGAV
jgi:hypothetical protein